MSAKLLTLEHLRELSDDFLYRNYATLWPTLN